MSVTLGVGDTYGLSVECTVRDRKGETRGESKAIHSSHRSGLGEKYVCWRYNTQQIDMEVADDIVVLTIRYSEQT